jgi:uncharacterized membrane protein
VDFYPIFVIAVVIIGIIAIMVYLLRPDKEEEGLAVNSNVQSVHREAQPETISVSLELATQHVLHEDNPVNSQASGVSPSAMLERSRVARTGITDRDYREALRNMLKQDSTDDSRVS